MDALVVHYHEISLKGRNREFFEETLARNLRFALRNTGYDRVRRGFGRIMVTFHPDGDAAAAARRAARLPGVAYVGVGRSVEPELPAVTAAALDTLRSAPGKSFAVRARRTYSRFPLKAHEVNVEVGRALVEGTGRRVDLGSPDVTVHIELFGGAAVVYRDRLEGPGGLPVGVSGRMLALLSGGIDSPVAAYRMMLRGVEVEFVHFHGQPYTDPSSVRQARDLVERLTRYQLRSVLHLVPLADVQREIVVNAPASMRVVLYRRAMMRIASALAAQRGAAALITGDSLGQVASQTVENLRTVDAAVPGTQVFRPLIGTDKTEIIELARRIGSYSLSIRRYQDCCVLFEPRSPATRTDPALAERAEQGIDIQELTAKALAGAETEELELPPHAREAEAVTASL